ncbi:RED-like protein N-terminal region-domain-containing protein [Hyaloraphidium curvatum]|nr:RED-like protein N-terminal region-domain-containing protein [Hyaloraphidium curvatum]
MAGLGQDDFRRLLATPRSVQAKDGFKAPAPRLAPPGQKVSIPSTPRTSDATPKRGGGGGGNKFNKFRDKKKKDDEAEESGTGASYRDRARERRDGKSGDADFEETPSRLAQNEGMPRRTAVSRGSEDDDPLADLADESEPNKASSTSVETPQLLGGDALPVRGLDKTLLNRVREEIKAREVTDAELKEAEEYVRRIDGDAEPEFLGLMAKAIYQQVVAGKKEPPLTNPMFAEGRMAFVFDLGFEGDAYIGSPDMPTTLLRSRLEVSGDDAARRASDQVALKVADALAALRTNGADGDVIIGEDGKRRIKKKDKEERERQKQKEEEKPVKPAAAPAPSKPEPVVGIDDDEDIFGDAGRDYTLEVDDRRRREAEAKLAALEAASEEPAPAPSAAADEPEEDIFGPQIPAEFRRARSEEPEAEEDEDTFGPQIPVEFRRPRDEDEEDGEMEVDEPAFGPQVPAEFRRPQTPSDDGVDEEEEYRRRAAVAPAPKAEDEGPKHVKTDWFGKVVVDGREVEEVEKEPKAKIAELVRTVAGEAAAAEIEGPPPEARGFGTAAEKRKKPRKRALDEDEGDYYTGLGGSYGYDSDDDDTFSSKKAAAEPEEEGKGKRGKGKGGGGGKGDDGKKKAKLNEEFQALDKKMQEKWGVSLAGKK